MLHLGLLAQLVEFSLHLQLHLLCPRLRSPSSVEWVHFSSGNCPLTDTQLPTLMLQKMQISCAGLYPSTADLPHWMKHVAHCLARAADRIAVGQLVT